ncbi:proteasome regulatory particle base subunit rpn10, partial [Dimargaris xerosporica]
HRANKNQRQRIVAFVGSPIETDEKTLVRLAKKLKKNNIAVDFVNFGEITENESKLEAFITNINSNDNSHLVTIPPGPHILSDLIRTSPILGGDGSGAGGSGYGGGDGGDFEFGVDPSLDPELAMALRMSMEEEQARQAAAKAQAQGGGSGGEGASSTTTAKQPQVGSVDANSQPPSQSIAGQQSTGDEDAMLARALAMSTDGDVQMGDADEDEELARAIALSMQQQQQPPSGATSSQRDGDDLMSSVINSLPGVDPNDPQLKDMLDDKSKKDTKRDQQ